MSASPTIVSLVGLPGAGKSTVADRLGRRWGWPACDLDRRIEARAGCSVAELFRREGEAGFRRREATALDDVLRGGPCVLATGGGTPCGDGVVARLRARGPVIWLRARPETLARRMAGSAHPMLGDAEPRERLAALEAARRPCYAEADHAVDVDERDPEAVADAIEASRVGARSSAAEPAGATAEAEGAVGTPATPSEAHPRGLERTRHVELGARSYPVHLVEGLPGPVVAREVRRIRHERTGTSEGRTLVVTDDHVGRLYAEGVVDALEAEGLRPTVATVPAGETAKTLATVERLVDEALAHGVGRGDLLVGLGGGVVGDVTGFAASILHRGVAHLLVPTSLLAQVDASVGGKTGVNHARGKNLLGTFHQPRAVVASHAVLETLPARHRRAGLAEALKHGLIADAELVARCRARADALRRLEPSEVVELVDRCVAIKAGVVAADEREERGRREHLNLGHTFGHARERIQAERGVPEPGRLTHGEAVALGLVDAARLSEVFGVARSGLAAEVESLLAELGLPHEVDGPADPSPAERVRAARSDKKADGEDVRLVLLAEIGRSLIRTRRWDEIEDVLDHCAASSPASREPVA